MHKYYYYIIMCLFVGEPEIWHQYPVLENRWGHDGIQSGETCSTEKCPNRRSETCLTHQFPLHSIISNKSIHYFPFYSLSFPYQELPTHQSVSHVSQGHSVKSQVPPPVNPVLGTPSLATVPAPAPPATPPFNMQVGKHWKKDVHLIVICTAHSSM